MAASVPLRGSRWLVRRAYIGSSGHDRMRPLICTFFSAAILAAGCGRSGSSAVTDGVAGQKIVKDASSDRSAPTRTGTASSPDPASDYGSVHDGEKAQATFSGGDGSSIEHAV